MDQDKANRGVVDNIKESDRKESHADRIWTNASSDYWTAFDAGNVVKRDRSPHDVLVAAAAVPLSPGGPEELRTDDDKVCPENCRWGGTQGAIVTVVLPWHLGSPMGDYEYVPQARTVEDRTSMT
jgi:hypothetical protein